MSTMNLEETNILLIGFMGTGKTTVSKELAKKTQMPEIDMDRYIVEYENMSIADIFSQKGEPYFRNLETECLKKILKTILLPMKTLTTMVKPLPKTTFLAQTPSE